MSNITSTDLVPLQEFRNSQQCAPVSARDDIIQPGHQWFSCFNDLQDGLITNLWNDLSRISVKPSKFESASVAEAERAIFSQNPFDRWRSCNMIACFQHDSLAMNFSRPQTNFLQSSFPFYWKKLRARDPVTDAVGDSAADADC
jgi:hypothetical protein